MHALRTRFKKQIVAEYLPPARTTKKQRVIILCGGMPTVPEKTALLEFFSKKGFWVFFPRYRGTWESDGTFLSKSPHLDILDVIDGLNSEFSATSDEDYRKTPVYKLRPDEIYVVGTSFGGAAALYTSISPAVTKVIAISPVIDWTKTGADEPLDELEKFTRYAFGQGYRPAKNGWKKIASGKFYNPVNLSNKIDGSKVLIMHAKDDTVCPYQTTLDFATATGSTLITLPRGGHLSSSILTKARFYASFKKFINT